MPFFSVIIPLYNKEHFISDALDSVSSQHFLDYEVIIVDDGSTDQSLSIAEKHPVLNKTIITQKNSGVAAARNSGIEVAKGDYVALLDADDLWYPNHLSELRKLISKFPEAGLFCNNYEVAYSPTIKKNAQFNFQFSHDCLIVNDYFKSSIINSVAWSSAVAFTKSVFIGVGKFNTALVTCEDLDLWIRLALRFDVAFNPKITMSYKTYVSDSLTKNEDNHTREIFLNHFKAHELEHKSLKLYLDINRYALAIRCKISGETEIYERMISQISKKHLNMKQDLLLKMPKKMLLALKGFQRVLVENGIYLTAFK